MLVIDKQREKILRHIKNHEFVTLHELKYKFKGVAIVDFLVRAAQEKYIMPVNASNNGDGEPFIPINIQDQRVTNTTMWICLPKSNELLYKTSMSVWKWVIPLIVSIASLLLATANVILKIVEMC